MMGDVPGVAASNPDSRLSIFLARFDLPEFNSLPTCHFHSFGSSYNNFLCFFVPVEGLPLLEGLLKSHGDFTNGFRGGVFLEQYPDGAAVCCTDFFERFFYRLLI